MKRRKRNQAAVEDFRLTYLINGQRPARITSFAQFRFFYDEAMQRALWQQIGADLVRRYHGRKLWAARRFGNPGQNPASGA